MTVSADNRVCVANTSSQKKKTAVVVNFNSWKVHMDATFAGTFFDIRYECHLEKRSCNSHVSVTPSKFKGSAPERNHFPSIIFQDEDP